MTFLLCWIIEAPLLYLDQSEQDFGFHSCWKWIQLIILSAFCTSV